MSSKLQSQKNGGHFKRRSLPCILLRVITMIPNATKEVYCNNVCLSYSDIYFGIPSPGTQCSTGISSTHNAV